MTIKRAIILPDIHYPHHEKKAMAAIVKFLADFKPDYLIYLGDQLSLDMVSFWTKDKPLLKEGQRLHYEYDGFDKEILSVHEKIVGKKCQKVWFVGNHEYRVQRYLEQTPELEGLLEAETYLKLKKRGFKVIEFNKIYELGKLMLIHGWYYNRYHAAKTVEQFENSVCYAHTHNPQEFFKVSPIDSSKYHGAFCLPCLCSLNPDYHKNKPNNWINGFGVVYLHEDGFFNLYKVIINKGKFIFNNKTY
jgi:predicted phosphodiesterase